LDVTNPNSPRFLWSIGPETTGYSEMGQTWSTPQIGSVKYGTGGKVVFFIGGGYDENQDKAKQNVGDKKGRAVYVVDLFTGQQVWRWDHARDPNMIYCIPSDVSCVDTNGDGYIDRLYVGDTGGRLWRFDLVESDTTAWSGSLLFNSSVGLLGGMQKIFSRPDVTLENGYEMVFFGTGDREHLDETKVINQIYAIKDRGLNSILFQKDLENVTYGINSNSIGGKEGWYISLEDKGEKALAPPVVIFGVAYFTTFTPPKEGSTEGIARLYALNYKTGGPIIDLNPNNNIEGVKIDLSDRSKIIGNGIPSGVVISAIYGRLFAYTRFRGGVYNTPLKKNSTIIPIWWREVSKK
jgi:type IV pilus assembly protein PilY1